MVSLRPLTESNRQAIEALRVSPKQEQFVSGVADSLQEAAEHPDAHAIYWGVYADDTPVGFVMIADEVSGPEYFPHYLWKLLIDQRYQRQGFGTATLDLIVDYFRNRPGVEVLTTSAGQGDGSPIPFYERYGFQRTGEIVFGDEVLLQLELRSRENVELVRRFYADLAGEGTPREFEQRFTDEALGAFLDPEIEWIPVAESPLAVDSYRGFDGVRRFWGDFLSAWESYRVEPLRFDAAGDLVAVVVHIVGRTHELEVDETRSSLLTVRDGRVVRVESFAEPEGARDAAGIS